VAAVRVVVMLGIRAVSGSAGSGDVVVVVQVVVTFGIRAVIVVQVVAM
jgi:hypothetical protein